MYLVRADGNAKIGAGHLMRCITIVSAMCDDLIAPQEVLFVCADELSAELVRANGFRVRVLGTDYTRMEEELPVWRELVEESSLNGEGMTILVDSYYVTDGYLETLRQWGRVILLDDMMQHTFPVDMVINYNAFADRAVYDALYQGTGTQCYVGGNYIPLRKQFCGRTYAVAERAESLLITTGGGDSDNIVGKIAEMVLDKLGEKLKLDLIIGRYNPHLSELEEMERIYPNLKLHCDVQDMAGLMEQSDLAITAGGTTVYELAAVGVPFICFSYAENQEALTEYIGNHQIAGYAGAYHHNPEVVLRTMSEQLEEIYVSQELRNERYLKEREMVDGKGAQRLAALITGRNL